MALRKNKTVAGRLSARRASDLGLHAGLLAGLIAGLFAPLLLAGQGMGTEVYLTLEEAPRTVFPEADRWERKDIPVAAALSQRIKQLVGRAKPTIWEPFYISFIASKDGQVIGYAVICEEIGKHRPITFIAGVTPDGKVKDVAIMMYREPQGGEIRRTSFLKQFSGKQLSNAIMPRQDIRSLSGATLSVRAMSRGVRKALAVVQAVYLNPQE